MMMMMQRLVRLREILTAQSLDAVLITCPENRRYLSGFSGSAGVLLISADQATLVTDFRYWEQAAEEASHFYLAKQGSDLWESTAEWIKRSSWRRLGFEGDNLSFERVQKLQGLLKETEMVSISGILNQLRWVKDPGEIALLRRAEEITDRAWRKTLDILKPGVTEKELALEFDYQLRRNGADGSAFSTIVASGVRSALPHGAPTDKRIALGELVLIDGGALVEGYHGDMTRTVVLGRADSEQIRIYQLVLKAQKLALDGLKAGVTGKEVDGIAREFLTRSGYGEHFGHGLGHSVGLEIHEQPRLSTSETARIPAGAVITVEPGIYLPGWGGIRIEDLVVVEKNGLFNLTSSPKEDLWVI